MNAVLLVGSGSEARSGRERQAAGMDEWGPLPIQVAKLSSDVEFGSIRSWFFGLDVTQAATCCSSWRKGSNGCDGIAPCHS